MKRYIVSFVLFLVYGTCLHSQLLWKISGNGLSKPSYILGASTYAPMESIDSIAGLRAAFEAAEQVCGVVAVTDSSEAEKLNLDLPEGTTLMSLFKEKEQLLLRSFIKKLYYVDIKDSSYCQISPLEALISFEVIDVFMSAEDMYDFIPLSEHTTFSDSIQKLALERGLPVKGLVNKATNTDFVKQRLYIDMPMKQQKKVLLDYVLHFSKVYDAMIQDIEAYQTQNLDSIKKHMYISAALRKDYQKAIGLELKMWADRMPGIMQERSTLFILPVYAFLQKKEKEDIRQRLRDKGYTVEKVKTL